MATTRVLPPISNPQYTPYEHIRQKSRVSKWRKNKRKELSDQTVTHKTTELVCEDVYLMDTKRRLPANLLANSLTARLRRNLPDGVIENETINKIRRDSLKDFIHLDNLQRQFNSEMQRENSRLDKESYQLIKRQKQLQKQSEIQRRKNDKIASSVRSRSDLSSASLLPILYDDGNQSVATKEEFPEFAYVDKNDQSHVKVFKLKGIYQPMNKYSSRIEPFEVTPKLKPEKKERASTQEPVNLADSVIPLDTAPKSARVSKKGLRVSWSRQSKYYSDAGGEETGVQPLQCDIRSETMSPDRLPVSPRRVFHSRLSTRSDTFLIQASKTFKGRRKVETIGLKWKLPPRTPSHPVPEMEPLQRPVKEPNAGLSHNLMPVTTALEKEGMSTRKLCWSVKRPQCLSKMETYQSWLEKLELLKSRESVESSLQHIPDRAHLSVMTQPAY